jgi:DNA-binding transcriptional LysR family regulator
MQIRALLYFDELVRTGSMRQAADNLGVAPTAVSRQIDNLEYFFGAQLVERGPRGVKLTAAGELLAARAGRTLREIDHVHRLIDDLKGLQRGKVTIVANGAVVANLLAPALAEFSLRFPRLRFEVAITSVRAAVDMLLGGEADLAVTLFSAAMPGTRRRLSVRVVYDAVMAPGHPAAAFAAIPLAELVRFPLAMPDSSFGARQAFDAAFARERLALDPVFVTGALEMQKELVLRGAAVVLLPAQTVERERRAGQLVVVPIADGKGIATTAELSVAPDRPLSFAAGKLVDFIERFMRDAPDPHPAAAVQP